jgi:hypothetical protein
MPAIAAISTLAVLIFLCGYRAHGALLQVVLLWLIRTPVGAGHARDRCNIDARGVDFLCGYRAHGALLQVVLL